MVAVAVYATSAELATWTGAAAPSNADSLLRSASLLIDRALSAAVYDVDTAGLPTDADVIDAMRDAACAQAAAWAALGIDPAAGAGGVSGAVSRTSIGGAEVEYSTYASQTEAKSATVDTLTGEAVTILRLAGLAPSSPWVGR